MNEIELKDEPSVLNKSYMDHLIKQAEQNRTEGGFSVGSKTILYSTPKNNHGTDIATYYEQYLKAQALEEKRKQRLENLNQIELEKNPKKIQENKDPK